MYYSFHPTLSEKNNRILDAMSLLCFDSAVKLADLTLGERFELVIESGAVTLEQILKLAQIINVRPSELVVNSDAYGRVEFYTTVKCDVAVMTKLYDILAAAQTAT